MECTNPGLFAAGPDWLEAGEQRRQEALWQIARGQAAGEGGALSRHVQECRACWETVESFRRLDRAAREGASVFAACPSAQELSDYRAWELRVEQREKVDEHLKKCSYCREDLEWMAETDIKVVAMPSRRKFFIVAAGLAASVAAFIIQRRLPPVSPYLSLFETPAMDARELVRTLNQPEKFAGTLQDAIYSYQAGDFPGTEQKLQPILASFPSDPSALYVKAMAQYRQNNQEEAARIMDESERTDPMSALRCWGALQMGLVTANRERIDRECKHLSGHPQYAARVRRIQEKL